eukprot:m.67004 g.67004  ORF g.67004 m.67004 type:complete len:477 (+) comp11851_c0_seq1:361-1791(+)
MQPIVRNVAFVAFLSIFFTVGMYYFNLSSSANTHPVTVVEDGNQEKVGTDSSNVQEMKQKYEHLLQFTDELRERVVALETSNKHLANSFQKHEAAEEKVHEIETETVRVTEKKVDAAVETDIKRESAEVPDLWGQETKHSTGPCHGELPEDAESYMDIVSRNPPPTSGPVPYPWCPEHPPRIKPATQRVYLAAMLFSRIYPDPAERTFCDLRTWLGYYRYAGVERVYLSDTWIKKEEQYKDHPCLAPAIKSGFVKYIDFHKIAYEFSVSNKRGNDFLGEVQTPAFDNSQKFAESENIEWIICMDMDEFPFIPKDREPGFLARYIWNIQKSEAKNKEPCDRTSMMHIKNVLVEGQRDPAFGPLNIQQSTRVALRGEPGNKKQIVRVKAVKYHQVHTSKTKFGRNFDPAQEDIQMLHVWGGRRYKWRKISELTPPEKEELFRKTKELDLGAIPERLIPCWPNREDWAEDYLYYSNKTR